MKRLLTALVVFLFMGPAFADSWKDWNSDRVELTVTGVAVDAVEMSVPSATLTLDFGVIAPGTEFDVVVPVTNPSNRSITVSDDTHRGNLPNVISIDPPSPETIESGSHVNMRYQVEVGTGNFEGYAGETVSFVLALEAVGEEFSNANEYEFGQ